MGSKQTWTRVWLIALIICVQVSTMSIGNLGTAQASTPDQEIRIGGQRIGNISYSAENLMTNYHRSVAGFRLSNHNNISIDPAGGNVYIAQGQRVNYVMSVANNDILANLAASGHATLEIGWNKLEWSAVCWRICVGEDYQGTRATILVNNKQVDMVEAYHRATGKYSRKITLQPNHIPVMVKMFKVLSDETRMKIVFALCQEDELCVCDV